MKINSREEIAHLLASWVECGWLRELDRALVTFDLAVTQPDGWRVVSEGAGTSRDTDGRARWARSLASQRARRSRF